MSKQAVYKKLSGLICAVENCQKTGNTEWEERHKETIVCIINDHLPSGSSFDSGTKLLEDGFSGPEKLIFQADYHHMNESGMYDGWSEHTVILTPSLQHGFNLRVTGRDRDNIKEYIEEVFYLALSEEIDIN